MRVYNRHIPANRLIRKHIAMDVLFNARCFAALLDGGILKQGEKKIGLSKSILQRSFGLYIIEMK